MIMNVRTAALTLALFAAATPLACQSLDALPARTSGFALGLYAGGTTIRAEDADNESGAGLGLRLGYGFRERFLVFVEASAASIESVDLEGSYGLTHLDLGLRYRFAGLQARLAPYAEAAFSNRMASYDFGEQGVLDIGGSGISLGGGVEYSIGARLALDAGLRLTRGAFDKARIDEGDWSDAPNGGFDAATLRLTLGFVWRP
jgi:hypothetical protein